MANKPTQKEALLKLLSKGKPVDFIKAFHYTGCTKLGTRVSELIRKGFKFKKTNRLPHHTLQDTRLSCCVYDGCQTRKKEQINLINYGN